MSSRNTRFALFGMVLFATVLLLPHSAITQGKLNLTTPQAGDRPIMIADGPDPVPKSPVPQPTPPPQPPQPPKSNNALAA